MISYCSTSIKLKSLLNKSKVSISLIESADIYKKCKNYLSEFLAAPSAILTGTETLALRNWDVSPNFSSLGNKLVMAYIFLTN